MATLSDRQEDIENDNRRNESMYEELGQRRPDHPYATCFSIHATGATSSAVQDSENIPGTSCMTTDVDSPYVDMGSRSKLGMSDTALVQQPSSDDTFSEKSWEEAPIQPVSKRSRGALKRKKQNKKKEKKAKIRESIAVQPSDAYEETSLLFCDDGCRLEKDHTVLEVDLEPPDDNLFALPELHSDALTTDHDRPLSSDINLYLDPPLLFPEGTMSRPQSPVESRSPLLLPISELDDMVF